MMGDKETQMLSRNSRDKESPISSIERRERFMSEGKQRSVERSAAHIIPSIATSHSVPTLVKSPSMTSPSAQSQKSTTPRSVPGTYEEFVPRRVLQWYTKNSSSALREPSIFPIRAVVAFYDVSGFTPMTEKLSQRGPEGAEMVCAILSEYFTNLLDVVFSWGGDVIKFAGDALLVCFRLSDTPNYVEDLQIALQATQSALQATSIVFERQGVPLYMKVALGVGRPFMVHVGSEDRWEIFIAGEPLLQIGAAEHEATVGATVVSPQMWTLLADHAQGVKLPSGNVTVKSLMTRPVQPPRPIAIRLSETASEAIGPYIPEPARSRIKQGIPLNLLADIRILTVVFINLTNITTQDETMLDPLNSACTICVTALKHYRGTMRQFLQEDKGVTCIGVFGLPGQSGGDDAFRAMKAAMRIQQQLTAGGLESSIGVTTGKAYCGIIGGSERHEYAVVGPVVNLSARLMVAAQRYIAKDSAAILADAQTHKLAEQYFSWQTPESIFVKGKVEAVPIFRPLSRQTSEKIFLTKAARMVGRDEEYAALKTALKAVQEGGQGRMAVIEGEQGLGKSLLWERLARDTDLPVGKGETKKMENTSAFAPISRLLSRLFQSNARPDAPTICTTSYCEALLQSVMEQTRPDLVPLLSLLNASFHLTYPLSREAAALEGPLKRQKLFEMLSACIRFVTGKPTKDGRPFLLVIEDAHDMDNSSWAFLRQHLASEPMTNELWVVLHRPMSAPPDTYNDMLKLPRALKLVLKQLDAEQLTEVLCADLCVRTLPAAVTSRVLPRAQGNPFFASVLLQSLVEQRACKVANGVLSVNEEALETISISDQIERAILSRIDRLNEMQSLILRVCSCIGTEFPFLLFSEIFPLTMEQPAMLKELSALEDAGFLSCERVTMKGSPVSYVFPQTIVQEVAYSTFAFAPRQDIHRKIATWFSQREEDPALFPIIAQHYQRAGDLLLAAEYLRRTGDINAMNYNNSEALAAYETALSFEKQKPGLLSKVHLIYFHRVSLDLKWLGGKTLDPSNSHEFVKLYQPIFDISGFKIPQSTEELRALVPGLRKQWIRNHFDRMNRIGTATEEERPLFIELAKIAQKLYRVWIMKGDPDNRLWCVFWYYHVLNFAELADSPDLGYYYSFACTMRRLVKSDLLFQHVMPTYWARWALQEAARHPQAEFMTLQTKMFNTMFSNPDWDMLRTGFEKCLQFWKEMTPEEVMAFRGPDSQISYDDTLATYGAGLVIIGNFRRAYEVGLELSQTLRGRSVKLFTEIAQRHMAVSLIFMRRYEEAEKVQIMMEEQGTKTLNDRSLFSWGVRYALLHMYRGEWDLAYKHAKAVSHMVAKMTTVWFMGVYFWALSYVYLKMWVHYSTGPDGQKADVTALLSENLKNGPYAAVLADIQIGIDACRDKMWEAEYFMLALRRDKAITCFRKALRLAEKEGFIYARGKCHWALGRHLPDPAEAMGHLQKAVPIFETAGAPWEKNAVQEELRQAEQALMSTIMF